MPAVVSVSGLSGGAAVAWGGRVSVAMGGLWHSQKPWAGSRRFRPGQLQVARSGAVVGALRAAVAVRILECAGGGRSPRCARKLPQVEGLERLAAEAELLDFFLLHGKISVEVERFSLRVRWRDWNRDGILFEAK